MRKEKVDIEGVMHTTHKLEWKDFAKVLGVLAVFVLGYMILKSDPVVVERQVAFATACRDGDLATVTSMIKQGANVNKAVKVKGDRCAYTPLHQACDKNHAEVVRFLLANGARKSINVKDGYIDHVPLQRASWNGSIEVTQMLLAHGADVNATDSKYWKSTALSIACKFGHLEIARLLIKNGANVNSVGKWNNRPLYYAAKLGHTKIVELLFANGADGIEEGDRDRYTILDHACKRGNIEMASLLIANGAKVNGSGRFDQYSPLQLAAKHNHPEVVRLLLAHGVDTEATVSTDGYWSKALYIAQKEGNHEIVQILKDHDDQ